MNAWIVTAEYPVPFGEVCQPPGDEPVTTAKMISAGSCGTTSSTFTAAVETESADEAASEAMPLITRRAAWFSVTGDPVVCVKESKRDVVTQ